MDGGCQGVVRGEGADLIEGRKERGGRVLWGIDRDSIRDERRFQTVGKVGLGFTGPVEFGASRIQHRPRDGPEPGQTGGLQTPVWENTLYLKLNVFLENCSFRISDKLIFRTEPL